MFIDSNNRAVNIFAPYEHDGVRYGDLRDPRLREAVGITEISDPQPPEDYSPLTHFRMEQDTAPYVVFLRKPDEMITRAISATAREQIASIELSELYPRVLRAYLLSVLNPTSVEYLKVKAVDDKIVELRQKVIPDIPTP
jgi:hypothetical protein